ncbi:MAG: hypothetical protein ACPG31_00545 [Planctomycetota bacterium]
MVTYKEIAQRKLKLIERYRSALLEEMLEEGREQAMVERERERYAWRGEFRSRDEIMGLYKERKKWDRRFLLDTFVLSVLLLLVVMATPQLVATVAPKANKRGEGGRRQRAQAEQTETQATTDPVDGENEEAAGE